MSAIATLKAMLGLDSSQYLREMDAATRKARGFESDFKRVTGNINSALGALGVGLSFAGIIGGIKSVLSWADQLNEAASQVGMLTGEMAALNQVALQNGVNLNDSARFVSRLQNNILDAATGNERLAKAFASVGLDASKLNGMLPVDQLRAVMQAAVDSGRPLTALSDMINDRIGPSFVNLAKAIADNGFGKINDDLGASVDKAAKAADAIALLTEKMRQLGAVALTSKPAEAIIDVYGRIIDKVKEQGVGSFTLPGMVKTAAAAFGGAAGAGNKAELKGTTPEDLQRQQVEANKKKEADAAAEKAQAEITKANESAATAKKRELEASDAEYARAREPAQRAVESAADAIKRQLEAEDARAAEGEDIPGVQFTRNSYEAVGAQVGGASMATVAGVAKRQLDVMQRLLSEFQSAKTNLANIEAKLTGPED